MTKRKSRLDDLPIGPGLIGLLKQLPKTGTPWPAARRTAWIEAAAFALAFDYPEPPPGADPGPGAPPAR